ncbi:MAG: MGMT family protein [Gammaproteobacteria bacterium]|nr:MGMT family protein [Gammaproteobacteria bacterium]MYG97322.1 MGMT family protein [Gammaproteobacteria bacterium]
MSVNQEKIWHIVARIPRGKVATYGQVAELAGLPGRARLVGHTLSQLPAGTRLPWHRVVNSRGRLSFKPGSSRYALQQRRLEAEGVCFDDRRFSLRRYQWRI